MHANYLDTLDWGILIAYFLILIGIGIWASLKRKKGSSLFLAERSLKWHHIGFSMRSADPQWRKRSRKVSESNVGRSA